MGIENKAKCYQVVRNSFVLELSYAVKLEN